MRAAIVEEATAGVVVVGVVDVGCGVRLGSDDSSAVREGLLDDVVDLRAARIS